MMEEVLEKPKDDRYITLLLVLLQRLNDATKEWQDSMYTSKNACARMLLLREVLADHGKIEITAGYMHNLTLDIDGRKEVIGFV